MRLICSYVEWYNALWKTASMVLCASLNILTYSTVIGASLSEPHTSEFNGGIFIYIYIYIYICRTSLTIQYPAAVLIFLAFLTIVGFVPVCGRIFIAAVRYSLSCECFSLVDYTEVAVSSITKCLSTSTIYRKAARCDKKIVCSFD